MGATIPTLSPSNSEDNMNPSDKDSIRCCALWVSEGEPCPDSFSPIEIPKLIASEIEHRISELSMITSIFYPLRSLAHPMAQRGSYRFLPPWTTSPQV